MGQAIGFEEAVRTPGVYRVIYRRDSQSYLLGKMIQRDVCETWVFERGCTGFERFTDEVIQSAFEIFIGGQK